ncbi:hypothetical protein HRbin23_00930 [bacterium HR23]|nr:hypothetical protein HRbin23_00930 [bacterium HR23]
MRVSIHLVQGVNRATGHLGSVQHRQPVGSRAGREGALQFLLQGFQVANAICPLGKPGVHQQVGPPDGLAEASPVGLIAGPDGEVFAVAPTESLVRGRQPMGAPHRLGGLTRPKVFRRLPEGHGDARLKERHIQVLPLAGLLAINVSGKDALGSVEASHQVADGHPYFHRGTFRGAGYGHQTAHPLGDKVIPAPVGIRAGLPKSRDGAVDDVRLYLAHRLVVQAQVFHGAGAVVLHHHIRLPGKAQGNPPSFGVLQVQADAPLVPVD